MDFRSVEAPLVHASAAPQPPPPPPSSPTLDPRRFLVALRRRLRLLAAVVLLVLATAAVATLLTPARYTATTRVLIDARQPKIVDAQQVLSAMPTDMAAIDTQVEVLRSFGLAERLVDKLALADDPAFLSAKLHSTLTPDQRRQAAAAALSRAVKVKRAGMTSVIDVSVVSPSPQRAAQLADALAGLYLTDQLEAKFGATRSASDWLETRLSGLRAQVEDAEEAVQRYKIANGLMSAQGATLTEQAISGLSTQLAEARERQAEADARLSTARAQLARGSTGEDVGEALGSPVVQQLRAQRAEASRTVADLQGRYGPKHPDLLKAQRQLADIDAQIQAEVTRVLTNIEAQAQVARQRTAAVQGSLSASRGTLAANDSATVRLNELQRNADAARTLYQSYLDRFKQTTAQQGIEQADARILSPARIPTRPSSPNLALNLAVGAVAAVGAGLAAVILAELMDTGLSTAEDVELRTGLPWLGGVPLLASSLNPVSARTLTPVRTVIERPLSHFSEALRGLRASVLFARSGEPAHVIAVVSALPGEGKTTTCAALARTMALAGQSTVAVNCDLRHRGDDLLFDEEPQAGLAEVLSGAATLDEALRLDAASGAQFLSLSRFVDPPKDILGSPAMDRLLEDLRSRFDVVLLDTAPVLAVSETRMLAARADAVVLLARWRKTPRQAVERAIRELESVGVFIAGVALTQVDMREQARSGYGDPGYYFRRMEQYYVD